VSTAPAAVRRIVAFGPLSVSPEYSEETHERQETVFRLGGVVLLATDAFLIAAVVYGIVFVEPISWCNPFILSQTFGCVRPPECDRLTPQRTIRSLTERAPAAPIADFSLAIARQRRGNRRCHCLWVQWGCFRSGTGRFRTTAVSSRDSLPLYRGTGLLIIGSLNVPQSRSTVPPAKTRVSGTWLGIESDGSSLLPLDRENHISERGESPLDDVQRM
jgi:hypothetical protein